MRGGKKRTEVVKSKTVKQSQELHVFFPYTFLIIFSLSLKAVSQIRIRLIFERRVPIRIKSNFKSCGDSKWSHGGAWTVAWRRGDSKWSREASVVQLLLIGITLMRSRIQIRIRSKVKSRIKIRISIKAKSRIQIRIKVKRGIRIQIPYFRIKVMRIRKTEIKRLTEFNTDFYSTGVC